LAPHDAGPVLDAAAGYLRADHPARAVPLVQTALTRVAPGDDESAMRLASLAAAVGSLSTAETVLGHVDRRQSDVRKAVEDVETHRMRIALPRDAAKWGVTPAQEAQFVSTFEDVERVIAAGDVAAARDRVAGFAHAFPATPGADVLACEFELSVHHAAAAAKHCEEALTKFAEATRAHYILGFIAARARRGDAAEKHLRRAIMLDPGDPGAWRELARFYRSTHASMRLTELKGEHRALFSTPLPE
jgi:predicted Zn-dependent protease